MKQLYCENESCKKAVNMLNRWEGKWICSECYKSLKSNKDRKYYADLLHKEAGE